MLIGLAGLGIAPQVLRFFNQPSNDSSAKGSLVEAARSLPGWLPWLTIVLALIWIALKTFVVQSDGAKRSQLAKSCRRQFRVLGARMHSELAKPDPMPGLLKIEAEITSLVDRNIAEDAWPWAGIASNTEPPTTKMINELLKRFQTTWSPAPAVDQR